MEEWKRDNKGEYMPRKWSGRRERKEDEVRGTGEKDGKDGEDWSEWDHEEETAEIEDWGKEERAREVWMVKKWNERECKVEAEENRDTKGGLSLEGN